ncbi:MAG: hypothetical protein ACREXW_14675 [Gammaproteobacteria bacterium]
MYRVAHIAVIVGEHGQVDIDVWGIDVLQIRNSHTPDCSLMWTSSWPVRACGAGWFCSRTEAVR